MSQGVAGSRGRPCPSWGHTQMGGGDVTAATVTRCQGLDKGLLGSGRASVRPGEVRRGQGRKGLAQGCRGRRGASHLGAPGPVLQAHHVPLLPQGWQRSVEGETPALLGQRISKRSPSTCTMFAMKQQDPDSKEQGESKASLPTAAHGWQRACRGSLRAAKTGGRGRQELPSRRGAGSLLSSARRGARWGTRACHAPFFCKGPSPALQPARQGQSRASGAIAQEHFPSPAEVLIPAAFALSPPACMLCRRAEADPDICGCKRAKRGLCAHTYCLVSSPGAPSSFLPGMVPSLLT